MLSLTWLIASYFSSVFEARECVKSVMCHKSNYIFCSSPSLFHFLSFCDCRKAVKATLVLLPLLGITYMLFFVNPGEDDISQIVFIYFNSFLQSFQVSDTLCLYRDFHACLALSITFLELQFRENVGEKKELL